ncbi:hypothetical protein [Bdellovibrio reynosensis]|uniref:Uncharacterized protein n=1 Tax=Bdellovibrio reynosensis TaxID=2835041 RepID=A0ABY4C5X6_9BACT|nr:hypothetical protein [Bdellovibrio reynosensis]UOF00199.1 hypothetical protein MNR06_10845 [Bdellovibrio reynosensis]
MKSIMAQGDTVFKSLLLLSISVLCLNFAQARVLCSATSCKAEAMPLLNQMDKSITAKYKNMGCIPTASAMIMEEVFSTKTDIEAGTLLDRMYKANPYQETLLLGQDMKTTAVNGTYMNDAAETFKRIATQFKRDAAAVYVQSKDKEITANVLFSEMKNKAVLQISRGLYQPKCTVMASGRKTCSFTRDGGHGLAVKEASATQVTFHDPGNFAPVSKLPRLTEDPVFKNVTLVMSYRHPNSSARIMFPANKVYPNNPIRLVETYTGIRIR